MRRVLLAFTIAFTIVLAVTSGALALSAAPAAAADPSTTITLVTHDSFAVSKPVLAAFTKQTGIKVKILQAGDAGAALNQLILTKSNPIGDVFFGVDNTYLSRALDAGVFEKYAPSALSTVPAAYQLDPSHRLTPIDHGDVCINYDKQWFAKQKVAVPTSLDDLTKPAYRGNDGDFTQGANQGTYPLVVSYASSPPAAVYFSKPQPKSSPIGTMLDSCFRQVEFAGVIKGTDHPAAARELVDFMLSEQFQADVPLQMFVFPVRDGTPLPALFTKFADVPAHPLSLPPARISSHRDAWIEQWNDTVLR